MSDLLLKQGLPGLNMVDFLKTGIFITLAALLYMLLIGRRLLPKRERISEAAIPVSLQQTYHLDERLWELEVLPESRLVQMQLAESDIGKTFGLTVLAIHHGKQKTVAPVPSALIDAHDHLLVLGRRERIEGLLAWGLRLSNGSNHEDMENIALTEVIIPPRSSVIGQTLTQIQHRTRFGLTAVALWREGRSYRTDVGTFPLQVGDALLMSGSAERIRKLAENRDYLIPSSGYKSLPLRPHKAWWAFLITNIVLLIAILDILPLPEVMLAGAVAIVLSGCLTMDEAYKAIEWRVIFLIAGMLPLSTAMNETGLAARIGNQMVVALQGSGALALVAGMFVFTMAITQVIGGQVAALVIGPIAITAALQVGINPQAMAVAVACACSTAFLTPIAHPVNILMMGPGGYSPGDFFKVGIGMTLVTLVMLMVAMALVWHVG